MFHFHLPHSNKGSYCHLENPLNLAIPILKSFSKPISNIITKEKSHNLSHLLTPKDQNSLHQCFPHPQTHLNLFRLILHQNRQTHTTYLISKIHKIQNRWWLVMNWQHFFKKPTNNRCQKYFLPPRKFQIQTITFSYKTIQT